MAEANLGKVMGSRLLFVASAPLPDLGILDDWAINTQNGKVWEKLTSGWEYRGTLKNGIEKINGKSPNPENLQIDLIPDDIGAIGPGDVSNPNLLDNWSFGNPVNQRGKAVYNESGYTIDRWFSYGGEVSIEGGVLSLSGHSNGAQLIEKLERPEQLSGKTVTVSVLGYCGTGKSGYSVNLKQNDNEYLAGAPISASGLSVSTFTAKLNSNLKALSLEFINFTAGAIAKILAVKLELGTNQTLARLGTEGWEQNEIPDYGEQLIRCKRYLEYIQCADKGGFNRTFQMSVSKAYNAKASLISADGTPGKIGRFNGEKYVNVSPFSAAPVVISDNSIQQDSSPYTASDNLRWAFVVSAEL